MTPMERAIAAIMARATAASGMAVYVDPVILRGILETMLRELAEGK